MVLDKVKAEKLFISVAKQYEEHDDIKDRIRSFHSADEITDDEYNYILEEWDNMLLKHGL